MLAQRYAEALRRLRAQDPDITLLVTESNPKLLEAFADFRILWYREGRFSDGGDPAFRAGIFAQKVS